MRNMRCGSIFAAAILLSAPALAATQGSLGATSTGSVVITASVPNRVQITGLSDISFANADPSATATSAQNVCVWSNTATRGYTITGSGSGSAGAFTLASANQSAIPYAVEWNDSTSQTTGTSLTSGTALAGLTSTATSPICASGATSAASLVVKIGSSDLQKMVAGASYTGTLTLLVAPQ